MMISILCQQANLWSDIALGNGEIPGATIGKCGGAVACIAMFLNELRQTDEYTPASVNEQLKRGGGFGGPWGICVDWSKVDDARFVAHVPLPCGMSAYHRHLISSYLFSDLPPILQVDGTPYGIPSPHFVLAVGCDCEVSYLNIIDPWFGDRGSLCPRYGRSLESAAVGFVLLAAP